MRYPSWIVEDIKKKKSSIKSDTASQLITALHTHKQYTICYEAKCPNKGDCFNAKHATFLILGRYCTRNCLFCSVEKAKPLPPDPSEPERIAKIVKNWGLKYLVFTSPTRDDLEDGGALHYAKVIEKVREFSPDTLIEPLIPDLSLKLENLKIILKANPDVLAHNIETVERLYPYVRPKASYQGSLKLLKEAKNIAPHIPTKSSIIIGMGEDEYEIKKTIEDLKKHNCDILVIGQYLAPSAKNTPVSKYYTPDEFEKLKDFALSVGFKAVISHPLARSSYKADEMYRKVMKIST